MFILGLLLGAVVTLLAVYVIIPSKLFVVKESKFDVEETVATIEKSAADLNWGVLHKYDLQVTLKGKGFDVQPAQVLSLCKPTHANGILSGTNVRKVSALMPCRMSVYEKKGKTFISILNLGFVSIFLSKKAKEVMSQAGAENDLILRPVVK